MTSKKATKRPGRTVIQGRCSSQPKEMYVVTAIRPALGVLIRLKTRSTGSLWRTFVRLGFHVWTSMAFSFRFSFPCRTNARKAVVRAPPIPASRKLSHAGNVSTLARAAILNSQIVATSSPLARVCPLFSTNFTNTIGIK